MTLTELTFYVCEYFRIDKKKLHEQTKNRTVVRAKKAFTYIAFFDLKVERTVIIDTLKVKNCSISRYLKSYSESDVEGVKNLYAAPAATTSASSSLSLGKTDNINFAKRLGFFKKAFSAATATTSKKIAAPPPLSDKRVGRMTASNIHSLMSRTSRKAEDWGDPRVILDLSATAKKYIFTKCLERHYGVAIESKGSATTDYGHNHENDVAELFSENANALTVKTSDFIEFGDFSGCTPDRELYDKKTGKLVALLEIKCATTYDSAAERITPKGKTADRWQKVHQALCANVSSVYYGIGMPLENVFSKEKIKNAIFAESIIPDIEKEAMRIRINIFEKCYENVHALLSSEYKDGYSLYASFEDEIIDVKKRIAKEHIWII